MTTRQITTTQAPRQTRPNTTAGYQRPRWCRKEAAHIRCGHLEDSTGAAGLPHRGRRETEAESVTHIVLAALGLDTSAYSDAYVLGWAEGDLDLVKECAETVLRVAKQLLLDLAPDTGNTGAEPPGAEPADDAGGADPGADGSGATRLASAAADRPAVHATISAAPEEVGSE